MNEQRIQAYLSLIQDLFSCPGGEEGQVLQNHQELIDEGFVLVCGQVAEQLQGEGRENEAAFLLNVAQQVANYLQSAEGEGRETQAEGTPEEYLRFLGEVLQATSDSNGDPSVVYPLLQQNTDKLDETFAQILQAWASHTFSEIEENRAFNIAADIVNFANLIQQFPLGRRADNLEIAIAGYTTVSSVFTQEKYPQDWATTQNNLAAAYSDRIRGERAENLEQAIAAYKAALEVYTRTAFPEQWATTQNNLANAYLYRIRGERAENLEQAIAAYKAALEVYTRTAFPEQWATTQNNLA
ncbi:tetratricopeptide repeat protein, partial [Spirulina sp. CS-785/01]|uniref:tetratricopeptide repeat protein n=1 Tax=Spirulina sp. CS-785/01 TaxID=3021716 RepID=UPI0023303AE7